MKIILSSPFGRERLRRGADEEERGKKDISLLTPRMTLGPSGNRCRRAQRALGRVSGGWRVMQAGSSDPPEQGAETSQLPNRASAPVGEANGKLCGRRTEWLAHARAGRWASAWQAGDRATLEGRSSRGSNLLLFSQGCSSVATSSCRIDSGGSRRLPVDRHTGPRNSSPSSDFDEGLGLRLIPLHSIF